MNRAGRAWADSGGPTAVMAHCAGQFNLDAKPERQVGSSHHSRDHLPTRIGAGPFELLLTAHIIVYVRV